jgi:hypothetical protein
VAPPKQNALHPPQKLAMHSWSGLQSNASQGCVIQITSLAHTPAKLRHFPLTHGFSSAALVVLDGSIKGIFVERVSVSVAGVVATSVESTWLVVIPPQTALL